MLRFIILVASITAALSAFSSGPISGVSGAPGEFDCTLCHTSFALNSGTATFGLLAPATLANSLNMVTLGASFVNSSAPRHGFQLTVRTSAGAFQGGWMPNNPPAPAPPTVQVNSANWVNHTFAGTSPPTAWSAGWLPPLPLPAGPIQVYAAGNQGNGDFSPANDYIYTASATIYQASLVGNPIFPLGSTQFLALTAEGQAGAAYAIAMATDPTPTNLGGPFVLPLNALDPLVEFAWSLPTVFQNFIGTLDSLGQGFATILVPNGPPSLSGAQVHFAAATVSPFGVVSEVSSRLTITLQ